MGGKKQAADAASNHYKIQHSDLRHGKTRFRFGKIFAEGPFFKMIVAKKIQRLHYRLGLLERRMIAVRRMPLSAFGKKMQYTAPLDHYETVAFLAGHAI